MKRLITIILCMILTNSCTGCSGSQTQSGSSAASGNTSVANSGSPQSGTNVDSTSSGAVMNPTAEGFVYVPKYMSANLDSVSNAYNYHTASFLGDSMYFSAVSFDMESPISSAGYQIKKMDLNTGETTLIGEPVYNGRSVQMLAVSDSGSIVLMTDFNGNASNLTVLDADGNDITPSGLTLALSTLTKSWSSLYMKDLEVDNDGNMYVLTSGAAQMVIVLSPEGNLLCQINIRDICKSLCRSTDGRVFLLSFAGGGGTAQSGKLQHIDLENRQPGESYEGIPGGYGSTTCAAGGENEILTKVVLDLYSYDLEDRTCEKPTKRTESCTDFPPASRWKHWSV